MIYMLISITDIKYINAAFSTLQRCDHLSTFVLCEIILPKYLLNIHVVLLH